MKALEVCTNMRKSERHCKAEIYFPKENADVNKEFWDYLGGNQNKLTHQYQIQKKMKEMI